MRFIKRNLIILLADTKIQKQPLKHFFPKFQNVFFFQGRSISMSCLLSYNFKGCEGAEFVFPTSTRVIYKLLLSFRESQNSITASTALLFVSINKQHITYQDSHQATFYQETESLLHQGIESQLKAGCYLVLDVAEVSLKQKEKKKYKYFKTHL